jgi:broad specificity phosphatase PhoE
MSKSIYFIRHGYAMHNDLFWSIGTDAYTKYKDTPLLHKGYLQANDCKKKHVKPWNGKLKNIDIVLVSPLSRCINTALSIFGDTRHYCTKFIALDCLMEYPQGGDEVCNKRKKIDILKDNYPTIDFSELSGDNWDNNKESIEELEERIETMVKYIQKLDANRIAVVSHSSFLGQYLHKKIGDEHNELEHCFPFGPYTIDKYKL